MILYLWAFFITKNNSFSTKIIYMYMCVYIYIYIYIFYLITKTKEFRINEHKNILKIDNLHFLPNNILTWLFKELKKYIRMTINNI